MQRLNFIVTNRLPRRAATRFVGWFSRRRHPLVREVSIAVWQFFAGDLRLHEARKSRFDSMHDCFIRELRPGARPVDDDPECIVSPCDAHVMAHGPIRGQTVFQAKGFPYEMAELLGNDAAAAAHADGVFVTLRLSASMYHRFHAPDDLTLQTLRYIPGDTWNVNPPTVRLIERLYCRNARAVLHTLTRREEPLTLVAVAAILVASIKVHGIEQPLEAGYEGPLSLAPDLPFARGEQMGYFRQGSTIIVFAPAGFELAGGVRPGALLRMGQPLLRRRKAPPVTSA